MFNSCLFVVRETLLSRLLPVLHSTTRVASFPVSCLPPFAHPDDSEEIFTSTLNPHAYIGNPSENTRNAACLVSLVTN